MPKKTVSIIIPAYNEAQHISACLESLLDQADDILEIVVVDDGSTDYTTKIVTRFTNRSPLIKLLTQKHLGPGAARNKAAKTAAGDILVFVDADMTFEPDFVQKLTLPIQQEQTIGTFSKQERVANTDNPWANSWSIVRGFSPGMMHPAGYPEEQAVFRAILREEFMKAGGFDTSRGYDDDWSLSERLGKKATLAKDAVFYHANPDSLKEIFIQARWLAKRNYKYGVMGMLVALIRSSWPISLVKGLYRMIQYRQLSLLVSQLVYDMGISVGLLDSITGGKRNK